jgi:hypothetical protein
LVVFLAYFDAWKFTLKIGKRLGPDWTKTDQDQKISRLIKTGSATAVWSLVHHDFENFKTDENWLQLVSTVFPALKVHH